MPEAVVVAAGRSPIGRAMKERIADEQQVGFAPRRPLRTSLEIFWDSIQWAAGRKPAVSTRSILRQTSADLMYRGFSTITARDASSPELPEGYDRLTSAAPRWPRSVGFYTRYGERSRAAHQD